MCQRAANRGRDVIPIPSIHPASAVIDDQSLLHSVSLDSLAAYPGMVVERRMDKDLHAAHAHGSWFMVMVALFGVIGVSLFGFGLCGGACGGG